MWVAYKLATFQTTLAHELENFSDVDTLHPNDWQVLSSDDITTLKRRLQEIRQHTEKITTVSASSPTTSSAASPEDASPAPPNYSAECLKDVTPMSSTASLAHPEDAPSTSSTDVETLQGSVVLAKQLAAKVRKREEVIKAEEDRQPEEVLQKETQTQDK